MKTNYLERMRDYLQDEYDEFLTTIDKEMYKGLSVNTTKCSSSFVEENFPYELTPSSFGENCYLFDANVKAGSHWTHLAGLYYLQEPSAASVVKALDIQEGDWVLDACAAPGGKSHQIACALNNTGFLLSNEIDPKRANILLSNMERCGVGENMITCSPLERLAPQIQGVFDKVLVDAPCSGEGMMKKHELASVEWSVENNLACQKRQLRILDEAVSCLKEGGILVYSTCTYAIEENEAVIYEFLKRHPEMELLDGGDHVKRSGLPYKDLDVSKVRRIYPMDGGEGHFFAKMRKKGGMKTSALKYKKVKKISPLAIEFIKEQSDLSLNLIEINNKVYARKEMFLDLDVNVLRQGIYTGEVVKNRFEPHQHFYMSSLLMPHYRHVIDMNKEEAQLFLSGNVFPYEQKGYVCCSYKHIPLGYGKGDGTQIKNKYPKGLRTLKAFDRTD